MNVYEFDNNFFWRLKVMLDYYIVHFSVRYYASQDLWHCPWYMREDGDCII